MLNFNAYGRIVHRKAKGCSNFYKLLSFEDKKDGWEAACRGMERDLLDFDPNYNFEPQTFYENVKKIMDLDYFNRIKQFMLRLYRNNFFLGNKGKKTDRNDIVKCFLCGNHIENRMETLLNCSRSNTILQFLIRILRKAGILSRGCQIDMYVFKGYPINSAENISLMYTWKYIYNSKFNNEVLLCVPFTYALTSQFSVFSLMGLPQSLIAREVRQVLEAELKI